MILGEKIATESHLAWVDFKSIQNNEGGVFTITMEVEWDTGLMPRLFVSLHVSNEKLEDIKMSPVLELLKRHG